MILSKGAAMNEDDLMNDEDVNDDESDDIDYDLIILDLDL